MVRREHDIFMDMLANPTASFDTMVTVGLTAKNTSLQDRSVYEGNQYVQDYFKNTDGKFDQKKFETAYTTAKEYYNALSNADYNDSMKKQMVWHRDSLLAPEGQRETGPRFQEFNMSNPSQQLFGFATLGRVEDPTKSMDELAQSHKVLANPLSAGNNLEYAQWEDTPNDSFLGHFFDTLVIAQWDSDGEHIDPVTGEKVQHQKGDHKLNQNGEYYYEKLAGRDVYGRRVLNKMNVLTKDGSWANKFDPFDSDDIAQKSIGGTAIKNLALVGSMFIPYVGPWIAGLSVATQLAGLGATLGKMALGSDSPVLNDIEGWSKSLNRQTAKTEYAQQHNWCWENMINLIGDTMGQLQEQRFIFTKLPALFKGALPSTEAAQASKLEALTKKYQDSAKETIQDVLKSGNPNLNLLKQQNELFQLAPHMAQSELDSFIKGYNKLGEVLSKGYMTAITVGDTYGEAKAAGASDLDATLLTLGYAAGEYSLLNTGLGEWVLPELRAAKYKSEAIKKALLHLDDATSSAVKTASRDAKQSYVKKLFNIGKGIANAEYANGTRTLKATLASGAGEGVEEVSEEVLADFSKACFDTVKWLQGDSTRLNTFGYDFQKGQWDGKEVLDRYGMSLVGGAIGGSLTNIGTNYQNFKQLNNMDSTQAFQELAYMYRNGELDKFEQSIDKSQLANPNNSATDFEVKDGTVLYAPGTESNNQDLYAKQALHEQCKLIRNILDNAGANISDDSILSKQTDLLDNLRLNALQNSTTAGDLINTFNGLTSDIIKLTNEIQTLQNTDLDSNKDGVVTDKEKRQNEVSDASKEKIKSLTKELQEKKQQIKDIVEGKKSYEFVSTALFEMSTELSGTLTTPTYPLYVEAKYGRKYSELTDSEKKTSWEEYKNWKTTEGRDKIRTMAEIYRDISEKASKTILKHAEEYKNSDSRLQDFNKLITNLYKTLDSEDESEWLDSVQLKEGARTDNVLTQLVHTFGSEQDIADWRAIIQATKMVDSTETKEDKVARLAQRKNDLKKKLYGLVLNNLDTYLEPFIKGGTLNTETKTQLLDTLNTLALQAQQFSYQEQSNQTESLASLAQPQLDPWAASIPKLYAYINKIKALGNTAFEKNLNEFSISIGNEPINITELLNKLNLTLKTASSNVSKFNMDTEMYRELNNAINTIKMYQAAIKGARTNNVSLNDYFGYNATLNNLAKKAEGDYPELAEIDENIANVFIADINTNLNKLVFLKQLYQINQGAKLSKQDKVAFKKDILIYKRLKSIISVPDDDPLKKWDGFLELQNILDSSTLHKRYLNEDDLLEQDRQEFEKEKLNIEVGIYNFFQKNKDAFENPAKLKEFVNPKHFQLYTDASGLLNEGATDIDDNSVLWWIAGRAAINAKDFYWQYKQIIDPAEHIAPIATQELAVFNNYANIVNGKVFEKFYDAIRSSMIEDWQAKSVDERKAVCKLAKLEESFAEDKYKDFAINFLPIPKFKNIVFTEGIAGSGKTQAVLLQVVKLLQKFNPDVLSKVAIIHGASAQSAKDLNNDTLKIESAETYDHDSWMKHINTNWKAYSIDPKTKLQQIPKTDYGFTSENEIRSTLKVDASGEAPSLVIIDEVTKFNSYELDQIQEYAQKHGITVLTCGDLDQSCVKGQISISWNGENITWYPSLSRTDTIRTPKLGVSMRTDNSLKTRNQQYLQAMMQDIIAINDQSIASFEYYQDETGIYGDQVISYSEDLTGTDAASTLAISQIDKLIKTLQPNEKIGYICDNPNSELCKILQSDKYKSFIDLKEGGSAQGLESRYYIIEVSSKEGADAHDTHEFLQEVYTGITRAQQGSILITNEHSIPGFGSVQVAEKINENISPAVYESYTTRRKTRLENLVPDGAKIELQSRTETPTTTTTTTTGESKEKEKEKLPEGVDSVPPPTTGTTKPKVDIVPVDPPKVEKTTFEIKEFDSIPESLREDILKAQKAAIEHPRTDNGLDANDTKSDLKYGQIVCVEKDGSKDYGVIVGVKVKENGNHSYEVLRVASKRDNTWGYESWPYFRSNITEVINSPTVQTNLPKLITQDELENRCGPAVVADTIPFSLSDVDATLHFLKLPFKNEEEFGTCNIVVVNGKPICALQLGSIVQYFVYDNNSWKPLQGNPIDGNILNPKGTIFEQICTNLDNGLPINTIISTLPIDTKNSNNFEDSIQDDTQLQEYWDTLEQSILDSINQYVPEDFDYEPESLIYEHNEMPLVILNGVSEQTLNQQIDAANETDASEKDIVQWIDDHFSMDICLYSFNSFETGVLTDSDGNIIVNEKDRAAERRDSVNGLLYLQQLAGKSVTIDNDNKVVGADAKPLDTYKFLIGMCRSYIFNTANKAELLNKITSLLQRGLSLDASIFDGAYLTFAIKSTARPGDKNIQNGQEYVESTPSPYGKGISEKTLYNGSQDTKSNSWHNRALVAVIGTKQGDAFELPLLALSSPFTILKHDALNDMYFKEMFSKYQALEGQGLDMYKIAETLYKEFKNSPKDHELADLFGIFAFTWNNVSFIKDPNWTPANNLQNLGAEFSLERGMLQERAGLTFNIDNITEDNWQTIEEYKKDPEVYVTENILCATDDTAASFQCTKGHVFVLVSHDVTLNNDAAVVEYYCRQCKDPSLQRKVTRMYIRPPRATIEEYVDNVQKILTKQTGVKPIGQVFTSYHLLSVLMKNQEFVNFLRGRYGNDKIITKLQETLTRLDRIANTTDLKNALYTPEKWDGLEHATKLAGIFDGIISRVAYKRQYLSNMMTGSDVAFVKDPEGIQLMTDILNASDKGNIYYNAWLPRGDGKELVGPFSVYKHTSYDIDGKPFLIHGKLDSPVFRGRMGKYIHQFMEDLRPNRSGKQGMSQDGILYKEHKSNYWNRRTTVQDKIKSQIEYEFNKKGLNLKEFIDNSNLQQDYDNNQGQNILPKLVSEINSKVKGRLAFIWNGELHISELNDIFDENIVILDSNGIIQNDISTLVNSVGKAELTIQSLDGKEYQALYDTKTGQLEIKDVTEEGSTNTTIDQVLPNLFTDGHLNKEAFGEWQRLLKEAAKDLIYDYQDLENLTTMDLSDDTDADAVFQEFLDDYDAIDMGEDLKWAKDNVDTNLQEHDAYVQALEDLIKLDTWEAEDSAPVCKKSIFIKI